MIAHKDEIKIFNNIMTNHEKLTKKMHGDLCQKFKEKANGTTIFPKLPSMIANYEGKWKQNSLIQAAQKSMKHDYENLLNQLTDTISITDTGLSSTATCHDLTSKVMNAAQTETPKNFVPPINAPQQESYKDTTTPIREFADRQCTWYPFFQNIISKCWGKKRDSCQFVNGEKVKIPDKKV